MPTNTVIYCQIGSNTSPNSVDTLQNNRSLLEPARTMATAPSRETNKNDVPLRRRPPNRTMISPPRDHRRQPLSDKITAQQITIIINQGFPPRGNHGTTDWVSQINQPGGPEALIDAALAGDPAARKFLESREGSLKVQQRMESDARFYSTISNLYAAIHRMIMTTVNNMRP